MTRITTAVSLVLSTVLASTAARAFAQDRPIAITAPQPVRPGDPSGQPRRPGGMGPARDRAATPETVGTGKIRGRVTDDGGSPLRRVAVSSFAQQFRGQPRMAMTDADGRFELTQLPAGTYTVTAAKGAYVRQQYGQRSRNGPGRPIELADGQTVDKIDIVLSRGGVIVGRVVDELGDPMAETSVMAMRFMPGNSGMRLGPAGRSAQTDDLGQFRLYGLAPGEYVVSVSTRGGGFMFGPMDNSSGGDDTGYAPTYAPGTTVAAEATRIQVQAGQESNADVQLVASRMLRVGGVVVDSRGRPSEGGFIRLVPKGDVNFGGPGLGAPLMNGAFTIAHVPPGTYTLTVRAGADAGVPRGMTRDGGADVEYALVPVVVAGDDLINLRVVTSRGLTVPGVVSADGGTLPTGQTLRVMVVPGEVENMMTTRPAEVDAAGRFQVDGVMGEGRLNVMGLPRGWMLKAVEYKGANVTEKPIEFASDGGPLRVVITNRIPIVTGTVGAGNGAPATDYEVLIFPTDTALWESPGRRARVARPDQQGAFRVEGLPPGDYYVAAFDSVGDAATSPEVLARARTVAQEVTLVEGQTRTLSLRLLALPQ